MIGIDALLAFLLSLANAFLGLFASRNPWYIDLAWLWASGIAGFLALGLALFFYINLLGGRSAFWTGRFLNVFWIYRAAAVAIFLARRGSMQEAMAVWLAVILLFECLFVSAMAVKRTWSKQPRGSWRWWLALLFGAPLFAVGFPFDMDYNLTFGRLHFLQKPRLLAVDESLEPWKRVARGDWTFTANLKRNAGQPTWQGAEARLICGAFIEWIDPGHCHA